MELINPWLALLGLVLPLIVAAITKSEASSAVKGWTLAALSGVGAVLAKLVESGFDLTSTDWREVANNLLLLFASAVIAYKGGLVRSSSESIAAATADTGIGKVPVPVEDMSRAPAREEAGHPLRVERLAGSGPLPPDKSFLIKGDPVVGPKRRKKS